MLIVKSRSLASYSHSLLLLILFKRLFIEHIIFRHSPSFLEFVQKICIKHHNCHFIELIMVIMPQFDHMVHKICKFWKDKFTHSK